MFVGLTPFIVSYQYMCDKLHSTRGALCYLHGTDLSKEDFHDYVEGAFFAAGDSGL